MLTRDPVLRGYPVIKETEKLEKLSRDWGIKETEKL